MRISIDIHWTQIRTDKALDGVELLMDFHWVDGLNDFFLHYWHFAEFVFNVRAGVTVLMFKLEFWYMCWYMVPPRYRWMIQLWQLYLSSLVEFNLWYWYEFLSSHKLVMGDFWMFPTLGCQAPGRVWSKVDRARGLVVGTRYELTGAWWMKYLLNFFIIHSRFKNLL